MWSFSSQMADATLDRVHLRLHPGLPGGYVPLPLADGHPGRLPRLLLHRSGRDGDRALPLAVRRVAASGQCVDRLQRFCNYFYLKIFKFDQRLCIHKRSLCWPLSRKVLVISYFNK